METFDLILQADYEPFIYFMSLIIAQYIHTLFVCLKNIKNYHLLKMYSWEVNSSFTSLQKARLYYSLNKEKTPHYEGKKKLFKTNEGEYREKFPEILLTCVHLLLYVKR
jgi:hypothetical protein